jgi:hypothetical protein
MKIGQSLIKHTVKANCKNDFLKSQAIIKFPIQVLQSQLKLPKLTSIGVVKFTTSWFGILFGKSTYISQASIKAQLSLDYIFLNLLPLSILITAHFL